MESCLRITNELFEDQENNGEVVSSETLRNEAEKWSLKGDLNLLCTLENFSQDLASKSESMQKNLEQITYDSKMKAVKVKNLINDFQMLENCQFIENRVYDEEVEDVITNGAMSSSDEQTKGDDPEKVKENIKKSLDAGFRFIESSLNGFRQVNEMSFDSEEEEDCISANLAAILKENRFNKTPLPHIVGSEMFMKDTFFITSSENGTVGDDSGLKESLNEKRDDDEYISDQSSFDAETFTKPIQNHVEESNDDGIFVCNGGEANNDEPLFDSMEDKTRKATNESVNNKTNANVPEIRKDPFLDNIRDESDEDDDLFGKLMKNNHRPSSATISTTSKVSSESKKLFDDLEDDDLFDITTQTSKPTLVSSTKPKSLGQVNDNEVNAVDDDFDKLNNSNFKDRLSSILGGQLPKKPPQNLVKSENNESTDERSKTSTVESDSIKTRKPSVKEPLRIESDGDSEDDLFGKPSSSSRPKPTERKLDSKAKNLFADVDDLDIFSTNTSVAAESSDESIEERTKTINASESNKTKTVVKKPLRIESDSDSDNDLFGKPSRSTSIQNHVEKSDRNFVSNNRVAKNDKIESIEDKTKKTTKETVYNKSGTNIPEKKDLFLDNIHDESDEDDDLFGKLRKNNHQSSSEIKSTSKVSSEMKKLFDNLDEDDLFDINTQSQKPTIVSSSNPKSLEKVDIEVNDDDFGKSNNSDFKDRLSSILGGKLPTKPPQTIVPVDSSDESIEEITKTSTHESDSRKTSVKEPIRNDSDVDSEDDLFGKPSTGVQLAGSLFADMDDDDLFSITKNPLQKPPVESASEPLSLNRVKNSSDNTLVDNCGTLNNSMFKERAKLGAQRRKRNPTRKNAPLVPETENEILDSAEEPTIASMEDSVRVNSDTVVRESLFSDDSEDDLFGKSKKRTNKQPSAPKSSTSTSKLSLEPNELFDDLFNQSSKVRKDSKLKLFAGEEDDDLFSSNSKSEKTRVNVADPLFDSDDDLFSRK